MVQEKEVEILGVHGLYPIKMLVPSEGDPPVMGKVGAVGVNLQLQLRRQLLSSTHDVEIVQILIVPF